MKPARFVCLWTLIALTVSLTGGAPAWSRIQGTAAESQTLIQSVAPQTITLTAGGPGVTVTMAGTSLGNITAVQVVQQGRPATGFEVRLSPSAGSTRAFDIKAANQVALGEYQLRIILRAQKRDLSTGMASVIVKAGAPSMRIAQKAQATAAAPPTQASSQSAKVAPSALLPKDTRIIRSSAFNSIAMGVFQGAYFDAMSCGGRDSERKTTVNVPNANFKQEPLDRLVYEFTDKEKERGVDHRPGFDTRRVEIRACVDGWRMTLNGASIREGQLCLTFPFSKISVIKIRAMEQNYGVDFMWHNRGDWSDKTADENIQDFRFSGGLGVFLTPVIENGGLSYRLDDARWEFYGPLTGWVGPGHFALPEVEEPKIIHYKDRMLEVIRQRIVAMFNDAGVRTKLAAALTQHAKSGDFAGRTIASVLGKDDTVEVTFQK